MIDIIDWGECKRKFIRKVEIDPSRINSLLKTSKLRLKDIKERNVTDENVSFVIEGYYEIIKELLIALLLSHGYRSKNHQCLISFFYKSYSKYEPEAFLISQLSLFRNRLNYYGELIDFGFYEKNKKEFNNIIDLLIKLISKLKKHNGIKYS